MLKLLHALMIVLKYHNMNIMKNVIINVQVEQLIIIIYVSIVIRIVKNVIIIFHIAHHVKIQINI